MVNRQLLKKFLLDGKRVSGACFCSRIRFLVVELILAMSLVLLLVLAGHRDAQSAQKSPYLDQYLAPLSLPVAEWPTPLLGLRPGVIKQRLVGPTETIIVADRSIKTAYGVPARQVTLGISGSLFGYTPKKLPRLDRFADHFFAWETEGQFGPFYPGVAYYSYSEKTPAGVELLFPRDPKDWNGMLWVTAHGMTYYPAPTFLPRKPGVFNRYMVADDYAGHLLDKGYAVAVTRRAAYRADTPTSHVEYAILDDGTRVGGAGEVGKNFNEHMGIIRDFTVIAQNYLSEQLGYKPKATFYRGHSAGGMLGRSFALIPGVNVDHKGKKLFDGIYVSDTAGGRGNATWFYEAKVLEGNAVQVIPSDRDYLTFNEDQRRFMPRVAEEMHAAYAGGRTVTVPEVYLRFPTIYTQLKRDNARIYLEKGLSNTWRFYEILDVSHGDASSQMKFPKISEKMIDLGMISPALKEALVNWATRGIEPPPSRIDAHDVRELDPTVGPAIRLPETAVPLGVYREYMKNPGGDIMESSAVFIPYLTEPREQINADTMPIPKDYNPEWLEPLNGNGYLIDMDNSGTRTTRLTIEQAWKLRYREGHKTGILHPYERLTRVYYVDSVYRVARELHTDGLLTDEALQWYLEKALTDDIGPPSMPARVTKPRTGTSKKR